MAPTYFCRFPGSESHGLCGPYILADRCVMHATKADLRRGIFARRDLVNPVEAKVAARAVADRCLAFVRARAEAGVTVAAYWPIRSEIGTRALMEMLASAGFRTALPVTPGSRGPLTFRAWTVGDDLARGALGIAEPLATAELVVPNLLVVPLAAFDATGGRIGHGGGHYDRTLEALRAQGEATAIGLAYDLQEIDTVPNEPHDQPLDAVITPTRTLVFGNA